MRTEVGSKKSIIAMAVTLLSILVAATVCSVVVSRREDTVSNLQEQKGLLRATHVQLTNQIADQSHDIQISEIALERLAGQARKLELNVNELNAKAEELAKSDQNNVFRAELAIGAATILNIATFTDTMMELSSASSLRKQQNELTTDLHNLTSYFTNLRNGLLDTMAFQSMGFMVRRVLNYRASLDSFNRTNVFSVCCSAPSHRRCNLIIVTTTSKHSFGVFFSSLWPCTTPTSTTDHSVSFSLDRTDYATVKGERVVFRDDPTTFANIGEGEILLFENKTGRVNPGITYEIPSGYDPATFYGPTKEFDVEEIELYELSIKGSY